MTASAVLEQSAAALAAAGVSPPCGRTPSGAVVTLRPFRDGENPVPHPSPYDDWGDDRLPDAALAPDAACLAVEVAEASAGVVTWHTVCYGPNRGSLAWNIGIGLAESFRGRGVGTVAQRLLAEHLFAVTTYGRVEASTDVTNVAEQRALAGAGFAREGVLRGAQVRADGRHDLVLFSLLRTDLPAPSA